jgi:hypothetical protein
VSQDSVNIPLSSDVPGGDITGSDQNLLSPDFRADLVPYTLVDPQVTFSLGLIGFQADVAELCPFREPQAGQSLRRSTRSSRTSTGKQNRMDRAVSGNWGMADIDSMVI